MNLSTKTRIKSILKKYEPELSDGYRYYCDNEDEMLDAICDEILKAIEVE